MKIYLIALLSLYTLFASCTDKKTDAVTYAIQHSTVEVALPEEPKPILLKDRLDTVVFETLNEMQSVADSINLERKNADDTKVLVRIVEFTELQRRSDAYYLFPRYFYNSNNGWGDNYMDDTYIISFVKENKIIVDTFYNSCDCVEDGQISSIKKTSVKKGEILIQSSDKLIIHTNSYKKAKELLFQELQAPWGDKSNLWANNDIYMGVFEEGLTHR